MPEIVYYISKCPKSFVLILHNHLRFDHIFDKILDREWPLYISLFDSTIVITR